MRRDERRAKSDMKLYVMVITARRRIPGSNDTEMRFDAVILLARLKELAEIEAMKIALREWPPDQEWTDHTADGRPAPVRKLFELSKEALKYDDEVDDDAALDGSGFDVFDQVQIAGALM